MVRIDEDVFKDLQKMGVVANGESRLDFIVRVDVTEKLERGEYANQDALDDDIRARIDEQGREVEPELIEQIKHIMVEREKGRLILAIAENERIAEYQTVTTFPDKETGERRLYADIIAEDKERLEQIEENPSSFFERFFKGNQKS